MSIAVIRGSVQYSAEAAGSAGQLHCHVVRRRFIDDTPRAQYSITVGNETNAEASIFAFASGGPDADRRTVVRTTIGARSEFSTSAAFELPHTGATPELQVVVSSGEIEFALVVPGLQAATLLSANGLPAVRPATRAAHPQIAPAAAFMRPTRTVVPSRRGDTGAPVAARKSPAVAPILAVFGVIMAVAAFITLRPRIGHFEVPSSAAPGSYVSIPYDVTGLGNATYSVLGPSGAPIAHGPLALGVGSFALTLPPAHAAAPAYLVRVQVGSPLGAAVAEDYLRVAFPTPAAAAPRRLPKHLAGRPRSRPASSDLPQIRSLALDRATLASGETLGVYYDVAATQGSIVLTDASAAITYGKAALSPSGHATFIAPYVDAPRLLTVIASARRGAATTQSRIIVTVTPPADGVGSTLPGDAADSTSSSGVQDIAPTSATLMSVPATVRSREPIRVEIHGAPAGLVVALLDEAGTEIARHEIPNGRASVEFSAPTVRVPTHFVFTATYPSGKGSQIIVRDVTVLP